MEQWQEEKGSFKNWLILNGQTNELELERVKKALIVIMRDYLTERQKTYIYEFFYEGKDMITIAKDHNRDKSTVSRTIKRGMNRLYKYSKLVLDNNGEGMANTYKRKRLCQSVLRNKNKKGR